MAQFTITITRVGYASKDIEVEAETYEKAVDKAHEEACSLDFSSEHTADYYADNELPQHVPAGYQVVSAEALARIGRLQSNLREFEGNDFDNICREEGYVNTDHILYLVLLSEIDTKGETEWEGETVNTKYDLDKLLALLYDAQAYNDIIAQEKEDEEIQDHKDHKNGLYGEEY